MAGTFSLFSMEEENLLTRQEMAASLGVGIVSALFGGIHALFLLYYVVVDITEMATVNVGSVVLYIVAFLLASKSKGQISSMLIVLEISVYCMLSTGYIGWESGTQYFLPLMMFPCYSLFRTSSKITTAQVLILTLSMGACYWIRRTIPPVYGELSLEGILMAQAAVCMLGAGALVLISKIIGHYTELHYQERIDSLLGEAHRDALTRMWNRRYMELSLAQTFADDNKKYGSYIAIIDIDHFKDINDNYGHETGDEVLRFLADSISESFRETDVVARWGGEEFLVLLNHTNDQGAFLALEAFRKKVEQSIISTSILDLQITITVGYAQCLGNKTYSEAINKSDAALYYGKRRRRNMVINYNGILKTEAEGNT